MRLREQEMPLDPDVERELEAIDAALQGLRVAPELEDLAELVVSTRAERSGPEPGFAAELDEWAAAGFPRERRPGARDEREASSSVGGLRERLRALPPRRLLVSTGAAATLVVAVAVGISVSDEIGGSGGGSNGVAIQSAPGSAADAAPSGRAETHQDIHAPNLRAGRASGDTRLDAQLGQLTPEVRSGFAGRDKVFGLSGGAPAAHRKVAQNADLVLSAEPQDVRDVADGVVGVVDKYHGFVVSSNVTSGRTPTPVPLEQGDATRGRAQQGSGTFELRIPAQNLQAALGAMSDLPHAHVTSRTEGTVDITKRFNSAKAHVQDLEAERTSLLTQLGEAFTIEEQDSIKARLRIVENELADAKDKLGHVQTRIRLVPVNVEIRGERGVDAGGGGGWSIGDAFHDAGRVLTVIAGILLISAAVLAPLGLVGGLAWITARAVIRRRREDALE
jgi:Domain of unknown function (DUF4349)